MLRHKGDEGTIDTFQIYIHSKETITQSIKILLNDVPGLLEEQPIKIVWPRGFINRHSSNNIVYFFMGEGFH